MSDTERITANIARVRGEIDAACARVGRDPSDVTLVAVTKGFPASYIEIAVGAGLADVGESKAQELSAKRAELAGRVDARWHFIGRLQRNKVRAVIEYADVIQSVDRLALARSIRNAAEESERFGPEKRLQIMLQVDLDPTPPMSDKDSTSARGGVHPDNVMELAQEVAQSDALELTGLMAIASLGHDPAECFARLAQVSERVRQEHPGAQEISAGMSGDFPIAIENHATLVRVGTALFGSRELPSQ